MADMSVKTQAANAIKKAAGEALGNKVKDLLKKRVEATKALAVIDEQINEAVTQHEAEMKVIDSAVS